MSQTGQACRRANDKAISRAKSHENQTNNRYCSHEPCEAVKVVRGCLFKNLPHRRNTISLSSGRKHHWPGVRKILDETRRQTGGQKSRDVQSASIQSYPRRCTEGLTD
jgi:hypothetical protein